MPSVLEANLTRVRRRIEQACRAAGRSPEDVRLLPVTKSVGPELAAELVELGERELAENRVDELERKSQSLAGLGAAPRWNLIGHLQSNKVRRAVRIAAAIHSVDSVELLERIDRAAGEAGADPIDVYLELKLVDVAARHGFAPAELANAIGASRRLTHTRLVGLMTMADLDPRAQPGDLASQASARETFARTAEIAKALPRDAFSGGRVELSMGMSSDLEAAIHEGAHVVRIGTALFEGVQAASYGGGAQP